MRGNTFGKMFSITSFGESHGKAYGVVLDGVPSNLSIDLEELHSWLLRRAPGQVKGTTPRKEMDQPQVLSGILDHKTLGTPIAILVENTNVRSDDYSWSSEQKRVGHADQAYLDKFGIHDNRGGGRSSGRETIARVIGGYFASKVVPEVLVKAVVVKMGPFEFQIPDDASFYQNDFAPYYAPDVSKNNEIEQYLLNLQAQGDSVGGRIVIKMKGVPKGLGEPAFDKLKATLAQAMMSVGAVTSFSYGLGENFSEISGRDSVQMRSNFGGIEGGISNGEEILLSVTVKPTSTVGEKAKQGRHDPCILPRVAVVLESMALMVIADHYLRQKAYQ